MHAYDSSRNRLQTRTIPEIQQYSDSFLEKFCRFNPSAAGINPSIARQVF